jgi:hypothetical protein
MQKVRIPAASVLIVGTEGWEVKVGSRIGGVPKGSFSFEFQFQLHIARFRAETETETYMIWITSCGLAARISCTRSFTFCAKA